MRKTIEVIDDFYRDPYAQRERALAHASAIPDGTPARARSDGGVVVPDARSDGGVVVPDARSDGGVVVPDAETRTRIAALLGYTDLSSPEPAGRLTFAGAGEDGEEPHPHTCDSQWAALVYLALPTGQFSGAVEFCRPVAAAAAPGARSGSALGDNPHRGHWEETTYVPLTFNRMVLFQGAMAHRYTVRSIDRGPVEDRIAQLFLFNEPDGGR
ncbi:hypothetical protein OIE62_40600 [Streptomyces scopuliridis]|uniref:Uncharacterized protein n=1 Tax=Streptomyces scopuliridis TaxID=452529 RepID=A0ACD4ZBE0_9ACTN|nr:hypothetical protein [Streptomyces scopuliridis]WSB95634.1 hypothetical protein OG835_00320 [Streptomyces scopuliridis]WSC10657.1 hypothetical protein OIE62_40600 [Streptomyces scopuliridis]